MTAGLSARSWNRRIAVARKNKKEADAMSAVKPDDFAAQLNSKAAANRVLMLQERGKTAIADKNTSMKPAVKARNRFDRALDRAVLSAGGILRVCNLDLLWT